MTDHTKRIAGVSFGGAINALAAISAHIPCCGSQLFIGIFGAQTLGAISTSFLYKFQFIMPLLVSALLAVILILYQSYHKSYPKPSINIRSFLILNIIIGYTIVGLLYSFVPPHKHHLIDAHVTAQLIQNNHRILVQYNDESRSWPWSKRFFIADTNQNPSPAQELFWYDLLLQDPVGKNSTTIPAHLYARPIGTWGMGSVRTIQPLQFYVSVQNSEDYILSYVEKNPSLVIFYREDCPPCHIEINMLPELKKAMNDNDIVVVSLTPPATKLITKLDTLDIQLIDASHLDTKAILQAFHNKRLGLPFSFMTDKNGSICAQRTGLLGLNIIKDWRNQCLQ